MRTLYTKKCKCCNKTFNTFDNNIEFCNLSCKFLYESQTDEDLEFGKEIENECIKENNLKKKLCILCGWEFMPKHKNQLCCSKECSYNLQKQGARKKALINYYRKKNEEKEQEQI